MNPKDGWARQPIRVRKIEIFFATEAGTQRARRQDVQALDFLPALGLFVGPGDDSLIKVIAEA